METQKFVMLVGLPASGKSTISKQYKDKGYKIHSSDSLREELLGDVSNQSQNTKIFDILARRIRTDLLDGHNVVLDATNINAKKRIGFLSKVFSNSKMDKIKINRSKIEVVAHLILCPYEECIKRDNNRNRTVGESVIKGMYLTWQTPILNEGFNKIKINYTKELLPYKIKNLIEKNNIEQENKYHTKTISRHCLDVYNYLADLDGVNNYIVFAGLLHDMGKGFCKQFKDTKGNISEEAHYYGHENVGAYDSFFVERTLNIGCDNPLYISQLINYHMLPHTSKTEKSIKKRINYFGLEFWNDLLILNEADVNSR